jgi:hypothetical protein
MDYRALDKAKSRLRVVRKAITDLDTSTTFGEFADNWYVFLTSAKNVYTVLEQGSKVSPQSRQWFGMKKQVRISDEMLQYLYEARNDDEHGLENSVAYKPERHIIGINHPGYSSNVTVKGPFGTVTAVDCAAAVILEGVPLPHGITVQSNSSKPVMSRSSPAAVLLSQVSARGNRIYNPPTTHLGQPIANPTPNNVAKLAADYLESLVREAEGLA